MFGAVSASSILRSICDTNDKAPSVLPNDFSAKYFDIHNAKTEHIWQGTKITGKRSNLNGLLHGMTYLHLIIQTTRIKQLSLHQARP
jgi:hypothetical protein